MLTRHVVVVREKIVSRLRNRSHRKMRFLRCAGVVIFAWFRLFARFPAFGRQNRSTRTCLAFVVCFSPTAVYSAGRPRSPGRDIVETLNTHVRKRTCDLFPCGKCGCVGRSDELFRRPENRSRRNLSPRAPPKSARSRRSTSERGCGSVYFDMKREIFTAAPRNFDSCRDPDSPPGG